MDKHDEQRLGHDERQHDFAERDHGFGGSEPFGPQQSVGQVEQQACGNDGGKRIIEDHGRSPQSRSQA